MERDVYRDDLAGKDRDHYLQEPRDRATDELNPSTASYIRESRPMRISPFILAVAISAAIALAALVVVGVPNQADKIVTAPATTEQPVPPASH